MPRFAPALAIALAATFPAVLSGPSQAQGWDYGAANVPGFGPAFPEQTRAAKQDSGIALSVRTIANGLRHPWGIEVLPDGRLLVTERSGQLRIVTMAGEVSRPIRGVPEVLARRQGGLLDVALAPDFAESRVIYLTYSKPVRGGSVTAAARAVLAPDGSQLTDVKDIFLQTPASPTPMHYGSRIVIHDGAAWITTGEHSSRAERGLAQDLASTYGRVIRVTPTGEVPADNPFASRAEARPETWSYGHRNPQGLAVDGQGRLWALEHGPRGGDELNLIEKGANYGWPVVSYGESYGGSPIGSGQPRGPGFTEPRYYWDPVIAPGNLLFYQGDMFPEWRGDVLAASLSPGGVVRLDMEGDTVRGEERFLHGQMRIRDLAIAPDGAILALVDARNGAVIRLSRQGQ